MRALAWASATARPFWLAAQLNGAQAQHCQGNHHQQHHHRDRCDQGEATLGSPFDNRMKRADWQVLGDEKSVHVEQGMTERMAERMADEIARRERERERERVDQRRQKSEFTM
jgi:hypothetical protein